MQTTFSSQIAGTFPTNISNELSAIRIIGEGDMPSWFAMTDLAASSFAAAGAMIARLSANGSDQLPAGTVDRRLAACWFKTTLRPVGWELPPIWNAVSGVYQTSDGWIRLHMNLPHHRAAALSVLDAKEERSAVAAAVAKWRKEALMNAIVEAGGCAAAMNNLADWQTHPQGAAVAQEPLIHWDEHGTVEPPRKTFPASRPLTGIRILDLTRILAGPISTRFLAAYGADVLRIDPPGWDEPANIPEVVVGKRCAGLDLKEEADREVLARLIEEADVLVHGYRPGALAGLGFDSNRLRELNPRLIDVSLNAYGWTGPWSTRRGFDSLVQMSSGIADYGMTMEGSSEPYPLPAQALDHATGYLMAAAVLYALDRRNREGVVSSARLSLARTATMLIPSKLEEKSGGLAPISEDDIASQIEKTDWGEARRIRFPLQIEGVDAAWDYPARRLRTSEPVWSGMVSDRDIVPVE